MSSLLCCGVSWGLLLAHSCVWPAELHTRLTHSNHTPVSLHWRWEYPFHQFSHDHTHLKWKVFTQKRDFGTVTQRTAAESCLILEAPGRPWKMQDWGNQPFNMTWSCAIRSKPTYFTLLLQGLELPPGHGYTHFPTFTLLDLEKQLEVWCSASALAVLPTNPAVSFCPVSSGGLGTT